MPIGPFGEILGTTGTLEGLSDSAQNYKSKVIAPRNPKLVKGEQPEFKMRPSQFLFQMSMDTEQKLANMHTMNVPRKVELLDMADTTHQKVSTISIDEPMFQPFPSEIFYQNFEPFETYEVPLILRNNDKVPRLVKVSMEESPYFKIISPHNVGHKVGPGLPTTFKLQFTPEEKKDYNHELVCVTEREKFIVPVKAIGARAILDFPDEVLFQACPVKYPSTKTLLVRNIGNREAKFSLSTEGPYTVSPANGILAMNDSMQVTVNFKPQVVGDHIQDLIVHYDTGENIYVNLHGVAQDALVRLDKSSLRIENTYISMANQRTITITNRSDVIAHFRWTRFATQEEEHQHRSMLSDGLNTDMRAERDRFLEECIADPSIRDKMSILSRTYQNKKQLVDGDKMLFADDVFRIEPSEGDIWPNSSMEVNIIFKPDEAKMYTRTAFCDVTGRESRLPLRVRGDGIGPKVQFSYDEMDMGNIFINSTHTYEVVIANKGDIDAIFTLMPTSSVFGPKFQFNPSEGIVMPDGHQAIQITFKSEILGDFREDFFFQIDGSPVKIKLTFTGSVIGPTFQFDVPKLKFGNVSYGFVNTATCRLQNTSLVPMTYNLRVPGDGIGESVCSMSEYGSTMSEAGSSMPPKEFEITPNCGTIPPQSDVKIQVDLCSNTIKKYELMMVVDVEGVGDEVLSLPVTAKCSVPQITVMTPILDYGRCFLRHPYEHNVKFQNETDLPARYELLPQHMDELVPILYTSPKPKGIIPPNTVLDVPLVITPQGLEELDVTAQFMIFGSPDPPLSAHVACVGEGPVVHLTPMQIDWGQIPVLTDTTKVVRLSNESLIPAKFTVHMVRPNSVWRIEPSSGEIPPEEQLDILVTACLDDCVRFQDKIQVNILDGPARFIPVTAYGQGTTIVTNPPMSPTLNLGPHFSKGPCTRTFTLTNRGRRHQALVWSTEGFTFLNKPKPRHGELRPINPKDMKYKDMPPPPETPKPVFRLTPHRMELNPGESMEVTLEGTLDTPKVVKERMLCHAIIGRAGGKELIMKVNISCEFICPLLEFSTDKVAFRVDKHPDDILEVQTQELRVTNVSSLPVTARFSLKYPFKLVMDGVVTPTARSARSRNSSYDYDMTLGIGQSEQLSIEFDPAYRDDSHSRTIEENLTITYTEHPHVDTIALRGEVYFPNLEFEKKEVDFGCILNDTEVTRYINITNNSPMDVKYKWSFLIDDQPIAQRHSPRAVPPGADDIQVEDMEDKEDHDSEHRVEGAASPLMENKDQILANIQAAINSVHTCDITEMKSFANPPAGVIMVMEAVCILFGQKPEVHIDKTGAKVYNYWKIARKMMAYPDFVKWLAEFDLDNVPDNVLKTIRYRYTSKPEFDPEYIKQKSAAAAGICNWVRGVEAYNRHMKPDRKHVIEKKTPQKPQEVTADSASTLEEAIPILQQAIQAMNSISKSDLTEIKALCSPPVMVKDVMSAICVLLGVRPEIIRDQRTQQAVEDYWSVSKALLANQKFLSMLCNYDKDNIDPGRMKVIRERFLSDPRFTPEVAKNSSKAVVGLMMWIRALELYDRLKKEEENKAQPTERSDVPRDEPDNRDIELQQDNEEKEAMIMGDENNEEKKDPEKPDEDEGHITQRTHIEDDGSELHLDIVEDKNLDDHLSLNSHPITAHATPTPRHAINPNLQALLNHDQRESTPIGVEEVFDILPLYGTLKPGDTEQITLTFFGHADIASRARAVCEVEGGPRYEIDLKGDASLVQYRIDCLDIDYGKQMYDQVATAEIVLMNTGRVGFDFTALGMDPGMASRPKPGVPVMIPHTGFIEASSHLVLTVKFLPGVPEKFHRNFQIQVAHFEPDTINLYGEGVFPRISLDLPRLHDPEGTYDHLHKVSFANLKKEYEEKLKGSIDSPHAGGVTLRSGQPSDLEVEMEVERLVVKDFAHEQHQLSERPDILEVHTASQPNSTRESTRKSKRKQKPKPRLPDYLLDFGHVVLGTVRTHIVRATNTGFCATSFSVDRDHMYNNGFNVELDRVRQLPGAPDHETIDFVVSFDPRGANLSLGEVDCTVPINIVGGPQICIYLMANVTMPDMQISTDVLDFNEVRCGECKVITVQLHNHKHVGCEWNSLPTDKDRKRIDKHVPMHLRRKMRQEKQKPLTFEMMPPTGTLLPGQRQNVQVKFMPTEEKFYDHRIAIRLSQSSQRIMLLCRGQGQEPQLDFDRNLVEFGPILPHSAGDEQDIVIRNPCGFPIEFYNLEFDKVYLEEEKILRLMKGYDEYNTLLLPPRQPTEKLPQELTEFYEEQMRKFEEAERARREAEEAAEAARREAEEREAEALAAEGSEAGTKDGGEDIPADGAPPMIQAPSRTNTADGIVLPPPVPPTEAETKEEKEDDEEKLKDTGSSVGVGELEITPVSAAIARHLGIDLSPEGKAARNRRGVALIVHGAPMSGKTCTAVALAKHYNAALLTVDGIILEAISNGNTPAGLRAREMCAETARRRAEERAAEGGEEGGKPAAGGLSVEAVTAHTAGQGGLAMAQSVAHSMVSNRKTSTISDMKSKTDKHHGSNVGAKAAAAAPSGEAGSMDPVSHSMVSGESSLPVPQRATKSKHGANQVPCSPQPLAAPIARRLSVSASVAGEEGLMSCILPEDLLVELLVERLMLNDCHHGVVIDGLETLFSQNQFTTAHSILKAINNRKYIYMVTLKLDYNILKEQEKKALEEKEREAQEKEDAERRHLEEMSEDEYDALGDAAKAEVDRKRLEIKKERLRREMEEKRMERERREREAQEAEQRRLDEENAKKRKRRGGAPEPKDGKKSQAAGKPSDVKVQDRVGQLKSQEGKKHEGEQLDKKPGSDRPESHATERGESAADDAKKKKGDKGSKEGKRPISNEAKGEKGEKDKGDKEKSDAAPEEPVKDPVKEADMLLMQRFRTFEHGMKDINELIDRWERAAGMIRPMTPSDGAADAIEEQANLHPPSGKKGKKAVAFASPSVEPLKKGQDKKDAKSKEAAKEAAAEKGAKESKEAMEGAEGEGLPGEPAMTEEERREKRLEDGIGIPNIMLDCSDRANPPASRIFETGKLPTIAEIMDGLGLGPHGPPIPPPATFSVVCFPVKRHAPPGAEGGHYLFVASSPDDPNIAVEEKPPEPEIPEETLVTPEVGRKEEQASTKGGKSSKADKLSESKGKGDKGRKSSAKSRVGRRGSITISSPPPGITTPASETEGSTAADGDSKTPKERDQSAGPRDDRLGIFRWIIPANGEVVIRLRFSSEDLGQFDQTLNFEIMGTRRRYQLYCRGICAFPTISREPRIVFPHRKKSKKADEIVHKKYILVSEIFEFGPLLVGTHRDKYKEGKFPENMEKLTVLNTSPLDADVSFCFLNDSKAETYLLDPPTMLLKPGQSEQLTIWAYPKVPGTYEDSLVCCVKENPEPIVFKLLCYGVRPELELDKKILHFDKVLLHRKDTKKLYLRNSTMLPVAWHLSGLDLLGDDFSVSQESGVIEPKSEFALHAYFRAMKAVTTTKKAIKLVVTDVENIYGLVQLETIQVHAEAYDVALDMTFPKGVDGGIDFEVIRVLDEQKHQVSLKNKGKYEIGYSFQFEPTDGCPESVCKMFSVTPARGTISPVDRPAQVSVIFRSDNEVTVKDQPILRCQVIEPNTPDGIETIASIPIKISVRSVFSKYRILPVSDINFGAMMVSSKKTRTFVIENKGDRFEFKYTITKMIKESTQQATRGRGAWKNEKRSKSRDGSSSGRSVVRPRRAESISDDNTPSPPPNKGEPDKSKRRTRQEVGGANQSRLVLGMFTIFPAFGYILPGGHQTITVDCVAENPGRCEEEIAIDVTGRDPTDNPTGIPYKLVAEACIPAINVSDIGSIFEEHRIVRNLTVYQQNASAEAGGIYGEEENRFVFNNVLVGVKAKARFKITNTNKVPCDVLFTVKPTVTRHSSKQPEVFEVEPPRAQIPSHSHIYAIVSFQPQSMQQFNAIFEAALDGVPPNQAKGRNLTFEVCGEGNLPRIAVHKPAVRNKKGQALVLFKRNLIGQEQTLPLVIANDGTLPSKVDLDMVDPDNAFSLKPIGNTQAIMADDDGRRRPHTASVIINVGEKAVFDAIFRPTVAQRSQAHIKLSVVDNQYEDSVIMMVGEGYIDDITLDNIHSVFTAVDPENEEGSMADDDVPAAKCNHIRFGDIFINEPRSLSFTMTNHSKTDTIRFHWPDHPQLRFSPMVGHLHASRAKDMSVTFKSDAPKSMNEEKVACKVVKINFDKPDGQVADWDDRLRTVKWVDVSPTPVINTEASNKGAPTPAPATPSASTRPAKKKVVETEPEPTYTEVTESSRTVDMLVSANADFCKYKCKTDTVRFKDTLMFQTRVFEFQVTNRGSVAMDYNWQVVMENYNPVAPRSVTFADSPREGPSTASQLAVRPTSVMGERPGSAVSSVISDTSYVPYTIEPEMGTIAGNKKQSFKIKFSPLDMQEYDARLVCSVPNLEEGKAGPVVAVHARSLMPYCHFELEDSDYISSARRNPELRGPGGAPPGTTLDPNTRVIEFNNVGIGVTNTIKFFIVNPTNHRYSFQWMNEDEFNPKRMPDFTCMVQEGEIRSGKKTEVGFEFLSSAVGLVESFWRFCIPEQNISVPFLLVGSTRDPDVTLDRSHLNFKSLLIGHESLEVIHVVNDEELPFAFAVDESSCHSAGYEASLRVDPMSQMIPPKTSVPLRIYFTPNSEKEVNFNLVSSVKRKSTPLTLNVKAEGYSMNCLVLCEDSTGNKIEFKNDCINEINFKEIEVNEKAIRNIYIINSGKFNFDYNWTLNERTTRKENMVTINPTAGGVMFGEKQRCQLAFCPSTRLSLRGCELKLKISNGPEYNIKVMGHGVLPGIHFNFTSHNFGPCFIHRAGMPTHSIDLKVTNRDRKDISVDCLYGPTTHLHHNFEAQVIPPGHTVDVTFTFYPREPIKYNEEVIFEINGLSRQIVNFIGVGTHMKVEVVDPKHKMVKFGALRVGQKVKRVIPIINNSPAEISFHLALTPSQTLLQDTSVLQVLPTSEIKLEPRGGSSKVTVEFTPNQRIPQFTEEVLMECAGLSQPLFVINGCCQGIDIQLDTDAVPFGAVVQKSSSMRKLAMINCGDIGARFRWDTKSFAPDFSINPVQGYLSPGMEVPLEVTFHPQEVDQDIRYDGLKCFIEGGKPLRLTLTGMCTVVPPVRDVLHFTAHVRQREQRNLVVANRTNMHWDLRPVIDGEYFTGAETFQVDPQQTKGYELTYKPLTMTLEGRKHTGTVFFPLPDGTGLMYNVSGTAEPPKPAGKIKRDVPCKTPYTEMLSVSNWLKKPQRFRVKIEMIRPEKLDPGTSVKGLDYIDVPGNTKRDYKLTFYAHKEGVSQLKVVFSNEQTGEFQFFEVTFTGTKPGTVSTIDLTTPVRQSVPHTIKLENPLSYPVTFGASCSPPHEILMPSQLSVPAQSEGAFNFEYLPLKVGMTTGRLEFMCNDLGLYVYDLNLKATQAGPEKALYFRTGLGTNYTQLAKFINYAKQKTDYSCKIDNPDFHVDKTVAAAPGSNAGTEVAVEVTYEPSRIGESRGTLTVSSANGGDYTFPLFGTCIPPKPQGPFIVKAGSTTSITFRNVFATNMLFTFQVDNPLFHVAKNSETIRSRKDHRIVVGFDGNDSTSKASVMGKLVVSCAKSAGGSSNAQWVFYLKGTTPEPR